MKKRLVVFTLSVLMLFLMSTVSLAYDLPSAILEGDMGNSVSLLSIKKPDSEVSGSTKQLCPISGVSSSGVEISVWKYTPEAGGYTLMHNTDGNQMRVMTGASGLFYFNVPLSAGENRFAIRAQSYDGYVQNVFYTINLIDQWTIENIKSIFNGWFN